MERNQKREQIIFKLTQIQNTNNTAIDFDDKIDSKLIWTENWKPSRYKITKQNHTKITTKHTPNIDTEP